MAFTPRLAAFQGTVTIPAGASQAFPLFSPEGERAWVPGWNPEILAPRDGAWGEGQIFRTMEESGEATWVVSAMDKKRRRVVYFRVEPARYVAKVEVEVKSRSGGGSEARVVYTFVGLTEKGNADIEAMRATDYEAKMARWSGWIADSLEGRTGRSR